MSKPIFLISDVLSIPNIRHGFFTRLGGNSTGIYDSLNCALGSGDDPAAVVANRDAVANALEAPHLITADQCHSATALVVDRPFGETRPSVDALVTAKPGLALGILTADCGPILFAAEDGSVVGAAHAGWKGALNGIVENTIAAMQSLGARRAGIRAALGPCIAQASYQVGEAFRDNFTAQEGSLSRFFLPDGQGKFRFDLGGFIRMRLDRARIGGVDDLALDTYSDKDRFFSYRRTTHAGEPDYGRQISAIVIGS